MSVSPMKVISIIGLKDDLDRAIKILGDSQAFEPEPVTSFYSNTENFSTVSEQNKYSELHCLEFKYSRKCNSHLAL